MIDKNAFKHLSNYLHHPEYKKDDTFLNSPIYYALTGRRGAEIHQGFDTLLVSCLHPSLPKTILVFPEIGSASGKLTRFFLNQTHRKDYDIYLARYTEHDLQLLMSAIHSHPLDANIKFKKIPEKEMDWLFPVHILNTLTVSQMTGSQFRNIRQKTRQAQKAEITSYNFHQPYGLEYAKAAHKYWLGNQIVLNIHNNKNNIDDYYDRLFYFMSLYPSHFDGFIHFYRSRPIGFTLWDKPYCNTVNLIANLSDTSVKGLSEFQIVTACRYLAEKNIHFMNRGGSERSSLNDYKEKFCPETTLPRFSVRVQSLYRPSEPVKHFGLISPYVPEQASYDLKRF